MSNKSIYLSETNTAMSDSIGNTVSIGNSSMLDGSTQTVGASDWRNRTQENSSDSGDQTTVLVDPLETVRPKVAGWLLCVQGPAIGSSYEVFFGRNSVGRDSKDRIRIDADPAISRCQIYVTYDYDMNEYVIAPGEGSAITRVNGTRLDTARDLVHGDYIAMSKETIMRFIPACDASFRWIVEEKQS